MSRPPNAESNGEVIVDTFGHGKQILRNHTDPGNSINLNPEHGVLKHQRSGIRYVQR